MTDTMDVPMFGADVGTGKRAKVGTACGQAGRRGRWLAWALEARPALAERVPTCNRMPGHDGPHRYYDRKARVCAEWTETWSNYR